MKPSAYLSKAEKHRTISDETIKILSKKLQEKLEDDSYFIIYQEADGWCVLVDDGAGNAPIGLLNLDALFEMSKQDAINKIESCNFA